MKVILMRHGEAHSGSPDEKRELTDRGQADIERMALFIKQTGWPIQEICHSPLVRTTQTAQILSQTLNSKTTPETRLQPASGISDILDLLSDFLPNDSIIWVLHMPDVAQIVADLLGVSPSNLYFSPGTALALNIRPAHPLENSMLAWAIQPDLLPD